MRSPIVLMTDYGYQDPYAGILHGVIAGIAPQARVLDLTHGIPPQNIRAGSLCLESAYRYFPAGTIFVCVIDPGVGTSRKIICAKTKDYFFLAPDNGLLTDLAENERILEIREVSHPRFFLPEISRTFHGRDILAPTAAHLSNAASVFRKLGSRLAGIRKLPSAPLKISPKKVEGTVVYHDHFGNAVSNIKKPMTSGWGRAVVFCEGKKLGPIQENYKTRSKLIPLWNSSNRLEIALSGGSASCKVKIGARIVVKYEK